MVICYHAIRMREEEGLLAWRSHIVGGGCVVYYCDGTRALKDPVTLRVNADPATHPELCDTKHYIAPTPPISNHPIAWPSRLALPLAPLASLPQLARYFGRDLQPDPLAFRLRPTCRRQAVNIYEDQKFGRPDATPVEIQIAKDTLL
jgi:hypothetical protein